MAALAAAGSPAAAVVVADPGLGKTRLLDETVSRLGLPCVRLHGYEPAREIPLSATAVLLRELAQTSENGKRLDGLVFGEGGGGGGVDALRVFEAAFRCLVEFGPADKRRLHERLAAWVAGRLNRQFRPVRFIKVRRSGACTCAAPSRQRLTGR
jgi:hypothetical protein